MIEYVYQSLKDAILFRKIAPGTQLVEKTISEKLSVSRTPIRHAVSKLQQEGLVTVIPNRGAFVVEPTLEEIRQAFYMRKELETMAARLTITKMTNQHLDEMNALVQQERITYAKQDILNYIQVNKSFHLYLAQHSGNMFLMEYMERILDQTNVYLLLYDVFQDVNMTHSKRFVEHEQYIEAIRNQDIDRLLYVIDWHINGSLHYMQMDKPTYYSLDSVLEA